MALTYDDVVAIKEWIVRDTHTLTDIAEHYEVTRGCISAIARDVSWADVPWPDDEDHTGKAGGQRKPVPEYDPEHERIRELEAEVAHLTDEKNFLKRQARAAIKQDGLYRAAVDVIKEEMRKPMKPLPKAKTLKRRTAPTAEDLVLHLSDGHHDQVVRAEETCGFEEYNFDISCARAETLTDTLLDFTQNHMTNHRFKRLWVLAYGDHTGGEIHGQEKRSHFRNVIKSSLAIGQLHALMFRDWAPYFDNIECVYVPGNHGRRTQKKDHYGAHENWDYMIAKVAELWCMSHDNINFTIPNAFSVNLDILGHGFHISHGDSVRSNGGIPFYGMVRRQVKLMALNSISDIKIKYFCMGHHHINASLADLNGELIVNGAWTANDQFAFNEFGGYREPVQLIHGVHENKGISWRLPIHLKNDYEQNGPKRYHVNLDVPTL